MGGVDDGYVHEINNNEMLYCCLYNKNTSQLQKNKIKELLI